MFVLNDPNLYEMGGPGHIVQIDDSKFGKRKYNKGKRVEGVWVFAMIESIEQPYGTYKVGHVIVY